ncbi:hypothetical protein CURE108131_25095 [Cupriavidus respiraculi]|uniref:Uncharacterized protein n=1 Tax=Cupriavidus respiraculi TaxID=195930 RepID=A0ABN7ZEZ8_9BURK|nr:hypothetical protein [Cupriavidus respiraculi]CAG9184249.1 hypothetical protein LMG21510_05050 [Cupriavidus respiraculi]
MKTLLTDVVGLGGLGCLGAGLYLQFGAGPALMGVGALLLGGAVRAAAGRGR